MAFVLNNSKLFPLFVFCSGFSTPPSPCSDTYLPAGVGFPLPKDFEANPQRLTAYPAKSSAKHYPYKTLPHNLDHRPTNNLIAMCIADSAQTEYCPIFPCVCVSHRRDISSFSQ